MSNDNVDPTLLTADACVRPIHVMGEDLIALVAEMKQLRADLGLYSETMVAAALGVQDSTMATWRRKKKGPPYVRIGHSVAYLKSDVYMWLVENRVTHARKGARGVANPGGYVVGVDIMGGTAETWAAGCPTPSQPQEPPSEGSE